MFLYLVKFKNGETKEILSRSVLNSCENDFEVFNWKFNDWREVIEFELLNRFEVL